MACTNVPGACCILLRPNEMGDGAKPCEAPRADELVHPRPPVKRDAVSVRLENAKDCLEGAQDIVEVAVVDNGAPPSVPIVHPVRRVGEYEVDALVRKVCEDSVAVAFDNPVDVEVSVWSGSRLKVLVVVARVHAAVLSKSRRLRRRHRDQ